MIFRGDGLVKSFFLLPLFYFFHIFIYLCCCECGDSPFSYFVLGLLFFSFEWLFHFFFKATNEPPRVSYIRPYRWRHLSPGWSLPPCPRAYFFTFFFYFFLPKRERYPIPIVVVYVLLTSLFIESGAFFGFIFWLVAPSRKRKRKKKENPVTKVEQKCAFEFKQLIVLSAVCYRFIIMIIQL